MEENPAQNPITEPVSPTTPSIPEQKSTFPKWIIVAIVAFVLISITGFVLALFLATADPLHRFKKTPTNIAVQSPTPTPDPTVNWRTYTNEKYGFTIKYPAKGNVAVSIPGKPYDPNNTKVDTCGNAITETTNNITMINFDSFFGIAVYNSTDSIPKWISQNPDPFKPDLAQFIPLLNTNADEAYRSKNPGSFKISIYKKGNNIFLLSHVQDLSMGCIGYDRNLYNWDIPTSFKFTQ